MRQASRLLAAVSPVKPTRLRKPVPPSLEHFIQRQKVLALWRTVLRDIFKIPKDKRAEPLAYAKGEFVRNKHITDITQIRYLISTGKTEFETMQRYIDQLAAR
jgi:Complex 1 protein (LYR family)